MADRKEKQYVSDNAQLMLEWDWDKNCEIGLNPQRMLPGSNKKAWWRCKNGHTWQAVIATRTNGVGCPYCSNRRAWQGYNDLATTHQHLAEDWHPSKNGDLLPDDVMRSSGKRVWWLCKVCGHEWEATVNSRDRGNGCPQCAKERRVNPLSKNEPPIAEK